MCLAKGSRVGELVQTLFGYAGLVTIALCNQLHGATIHCDIKEFPAYRN